MSGREPVIVYALDLAVRSGVAKGLSGSVPASRTIVLKRPGETGAVALSNLLAFLVDDWSDALPDIVVKERPLHLGAFAKLGNAEATVRMQYGMHAIVEALGVRFGVPVHEAAAATIRKHFLARSQFGNRKDTKRAVLQRCWLLGYLPKDCTDDNRADACATFDWGAAHLAKTPPRELVMFGEERLA